MLSLDCVSLLKDHSNTRGRHLLTLQTACGLGMHFFLELSLFKPLVPAGACQQGSEDCATDKRMPPSDAPTQAPCILGPIQAGFLVPATQTPLPTPHPQIATSFHLHWAHPSPRPLPAARWAAPIGPGPQVPWEAAGGGGGSGPQPSLPEAPFLGRAVQGEAKHPVGALPRRWE